MNDEQKPKSSLRQALEAYAFLTGLGFYIAAVLGVCIFLGHLTDEVFALDPTGKLAGILLGFPVAIYTVYRKMRKD